MCPVCQQNSAQLCVSVSSMSVQSLVTKNLHWGSQSYSPAIKSRSRNSEKHRPAGAHPGLKKCQGGSRRHRKNLTSYFQPSLSLSQTSPDVELPRLPLVGTPGTPKTPEEDVIATTVEGQAKVSEVKGEKEVQTLFWKSVLSGPSPAPFCRGHRELCVMQIVKKNRIQPGLPFLRVCQATRSS
ncbi:hypothetical protein A6R68_23263 [Neotoma lepida]|uniref:Uncharacterized protein n=1 Tax=Neotoma lepida TaxID=56216 RepID=A0A1A6HXL9_NEOLE|nr:hypothetical protein A6R68_23263 [Neotoma lepida]